MENAYCPVCKRVTGHKRNVGAGTILGALVTGGASALAVPFYPKRCVVCGNESGQAPGAYVPVSDVLRFESDILSGRYTLEQIASMHGTNPTYIAEFCKKMVARKKWTQAESDKFLGVKDDTKECPYCAETIKKKAGLCRFCGRDLPTDSA